MHTYDMHGWYAGGQYPDRDAGIAPGNLSTTESAGDLRSNWSGYEWVVLPYAPPSPPAINEQEIVVRLWLALDRHLQAAADLRKYTTIHTAALRAAYPGPFHAEGLAYATWMDACNERALRLWAECRDGLRQIPTEDEFIALLPDLELPPPVAF